jgi:hypothetical protein
LRSLAIYQYRRAEVEARIEDLIALLDMLDGDPDLEDDDMEDIDEREPPLARVGMHP